VEFENLKRGCWKHQAY